MIEGAIKEILRAGNSAPSGENVQPWHFAVKGNTIQVYNLPDRDQSLYNWGQRAAYFAHGALLENMEIASKEYGYKMDVKKFPSLDDKHVATIKLLKDESIEKDELFSSIFSRVTNRKPYKKDRLSNEEKGFLLSEKNITDGARLLFTDDEDDIKILSMVGSANEEVMLQNKRLHNFFFSHISWTKQEDEKKKTGFYIKTLELPKPVESLFKIIKHWSVISKLNKIGFAQSVGKQNAKIYASCAGMGIIVIDDDSPASFIEAGRLLERVWLRITSLHLSMQPLAGLIYLHLMIKANNAESFSKNQIDLINERYERIESIYNINKKTIAFMFRVGKSDPPSAHASRFSLEDAVN